MRSRHASTRSGRWCGSGASGSSSDASKGSRNAPAGAGPRSLPPTVAIEVKALACDLPVRLGLFLSRLHVPDIRAELIARGIVAEISGSTIWRWLSEDAIRPWTYRSWVFPRDLRRRHCRCAAANAISSPAATPKATTSTGVSLSSSGTIGWPFVTRTRLAP